MNFSFGASPSSAFYVFGGLLAIIVLVIVLYSRINPHDRGNDDFY